MLPGKTRTLLQLQPRLWRLLIAVGMLLCVATLLGFLGSLWWCLDLLAHFRVQYGMTLMGLALCLLCARKYRYAAVFSGCAGLNLALIVPLYVGTPPSSGPPAATVWRVMFLNVFAGNHKYAQAIQAVRTYDPDFLILVELYPTWLPDLDQLRDLYPHAVIRPDTNNFGIALLSKLPLQDAGLVPLATDILPAVVARIATADGTFTLLGAHLLPPLNAHYVDLRDDQLTTITRLLSHSTAPVLLLGDLNMTPWSYPFRRLLAATGLHDSSHGRGIQPTWPTWLAILRIPIDHCLHTPGIHIIRKRLGPALGSDHYPLIIDFALASSARP